MLSDMLPQYCERIAQFVSLKSVIRHSDNLCSFINSHKINKSSALQDVRPAVRHCSQRDHKSQWMKKEPLNE